MRIGRSRYLFVAAWLYLMVMMCEVESNDRYRKGYRKEYYGDLQIESVIAFMNAVLARYLGHSIAISIFEGDYELMPALHATTNLEYCRDLDLEHKKLAIALMKDWITKLSNIHSELKELEKQHNGPPSVTQAHTATSSIRPIWFIFDLMKNPLTPEEIKVYPFPGISGSRFQGDHAVHLSLLLIKKTEKVEKAKAVQEILYYNCFHPPEAAIRFEFEK